MKPIVYFFGTLPAGFSSYPQEDHTQQLFADFLKRAKNNTQIVLHRKDNLLYYGYVRKFNDKDCLGICLCIDQIYCDIANLFVIFDDIVASFIQIGDILTIQQDNKITWAINRFIDESVSLNEYTDEILDKLDLIHNVIALPPADFSISVNDCLDISLEESDKIIDASQRYSNLYIVKTNAEIARVTSFYNIISGKEKKIAQLNKENNTLKTQNSKLRKQKENYKKVGVLICVIIFIGIVGVIIYSNVDKDRKDLRSQLANLKDTIANLRIDIENQEDTIDRLHTSILVCNEQIVSLQQQISDKKDTIKLLETQKSKYKQDLKRKDETIGDRDKTIRKQKQSLTNKDSEINRLTAENNKLKKQNNTLLYSDNVSISNLVYDYESGNLMLKYNSTKNQDVTLLIYITSPDNKTRSFTRTVSLSKGSNSITINSLVKGLKRNQSHTFVIYNKSFLISRRQ